MWRQLAIGCASIAFVVACTDAAERRRQQRRPASIIEELARLKLEELATAPGAANPALLEVRARGSEEEPSLGCQYNILLKAQSDVNQQCGSIISMHKEYQRCKQPVVEKAGREINEKCCKNCLECTGCEDVDIDDEDYEEDSPGRVEPGAESVGGAQSAGEDAPPDQ